MNYFNRNTIITIVLVALMIINITALGTIAMRGRLFKGEREWRPGTEQREQRGRSSERERGERGGGRDFSDRFSQRLDLTADQQERMNEIWAENKTRMDPLREKMGTTQGQLNDALGTREMDKVTIDKLNDELVLIDRQIRESLFEFNLQVRDVLEEEQLDKYLDMHKDMRRREGRQRRPSQMNMIQGF